MKCPTASDPIRPPEPVMIATGILLLLLPLPCRGLDFEGGGDPLGIRLHPAMDIRQHLAGAALRAPLVQAEEFRAIGEVDGHIPLPGLCDRLDRDLVAGQLTADLGRLPQRETALAAAADVDRAAV